MIALSTGTLYTYGVARVFELAAKAGYDAIELLADHRPDSRQIDYLRHLSTDFGLPIAVVHSPFVFQVADWPSDQLGRLRRTIELAQELGAGTVVTHLPFRFSAVMGHMYGPRSRRIALPVPFPGRSPYYHFLGNGQVEQLEAETGITIAVENMPARQVLGRRVNGYWYNTPAELARFSHLTLDTTHLGTWGMDPLAVYEQLRERVAHVHLSNFDGREHRSPPDGHLPLAELLHLLARDDYQRTITIEGHPDAFDAEDESKCLTALRRALDFCREHFK
ncbi:MAG: sugar phosphate isomerase/epimerase [Chloroflexi bacterium]|nr:sugar phosphate isomerase/epimerase [Chloroflexota bacterium]